MEGAILKRKDVRREKRGVEMQVGIGEREREKGERISHTERGGKTTGEDRN